MSAVRPAPRDDLRELSGYHSPQVDVPIRLNTNESPYGPPPEFVKAWLAALRDVAWNRYPDRSAAELRTALGAFLGHDPARITAGNGSNEVLQTLFLAYGGPGRRALLFEPTYALHAQIARTTGTEVVVEPRAADFAIDPVRATATIARTRPSLVVTCSPNNPTGTVDPAEVTRTLADACESVGAVLVVDEAYGEFAPWTALDLVADDRSIAVVRTYSKVWSLAGLRLGFAVAPEWLGADLAKVQLPYNLSVPTQVAGTLALRYRARMEERVAVLGAGREQLFTGLRACPAVEAFPSGANFVLFRVTDDAHGLWVRLLDRGVLVRDFSAWPGVEGCLRVTVGTPEENDAFLEALTEEMA
ncbi:MAG: histidinol-phosphate transaminase [Actinomycetota bacterium]